MKNFKLLYLMILLVFTGCEDFLEEKPVDEAALDQYYTQPEHARDAVNSLYRTGAMQLYTGGVYNGSRAMFGPYASGFVDNDYKGQEVHVGYAQEMTFTEINLNSYFNSFWSDMYLGISRANSAIKYIPQITDFTGSEGDQYMAEARFFRALNYFYLVRYFGGVPLITEPYESIGNLEVGRNTAQEVYGLIIEDLTFAINSGALGNSSLPSNLGRITESVAQTVLADVYLTMSGEAVGEDRYAEAATAARAVINSGIYGLTQNTFSGGELAENGSAYNKLKDSRLAENEYIYYYEYQIGISNNPYPQYSFPVSVSPLVSYAITNNAYKPTEDLLNAYDPDRDLRIQEQQYFHSSAVIPGEGEVEFTTSPYMWMDEEALYETALSQNVKPIYTYANVLLMAAEAIAESEGVTAEAVDYLAQVRERAYWQEDPASIRQSLASLSPEAFVEEVWKERVRELVFDFTIWFDVLRTRQFPVTNNGEIEFVNAVGATNSFGGVITESDLLLPIPEMELQRNPSLTQNPGYED